LLAVAVLIVEDMHILDFRLWITVKSSIKHLR
jgi:hypothetical protein